MKKIFSKKSGFSLVEIVVAFMVFAIMATMVAQVLNLTINRRNENTKYEQYLQDQNKTIIAKGKNMDFEMPEGADPNAYKDGDLHLAFTYDGNDVPIDLRYQFKNADGVAHDAGGINYFVGDMKYDEAHGDIEYDSSYGSGGLGGEAGGSSQMSRFDTRITGTKGISSVTVNCNYNASTGTYTVSVSANTSGVDPVIKNHAQVSIFFGENVADGKKATIVELNGNTTNESTLKYVKKVGTSGVNIHCKDGGSLAESFTVKFAEPIANLGFSDATSGNTFTPYKGYVNIFGAYETTAAEGSGADA